MLASPELCLESSRAAEESIVMAAITAKETTAKSLVHQGQGEVAALALAVACISGSRMLAKALRWSILNRSNMDRRFRR